MVILSAYHIYIIILLSVEYSTGIANALKCFYSNAPSSSPPPAPLAAINANGNENNVQPNAFLQLANDKSDEDEQTNRTCNRMCYSVWEYDAYDLFNTSRYELLTGGCSDEGENLHQYQCILLLKTFKKAKNNSSFCCCYGNKCKSDNSININLVDELIDANDYYKEDYQNYMIFLILIFIIFFVFVIVSAKFVKFIYSNDKITNHNKTTDSLHLLDPHSQQVSSQQTKSSIHFSKEYMENLILVEVICHGKYGTIWKGKFNDMAVAVKVCADSYKQHLWTNECSIYSLPLMDHPNLPIFYRNMERSTENENIEHCLIIEYGHYGSLQSYLSEHTFDWSRMCQLFKTLVQGLAYLHTEISKDGKVKPSIAHCDLSSANVIVKADGTCMICDFQFAVQFSNGENPVVRERSGNVRYYAPEILDGAINLRQSESSLKQADVYSLGLILWEIATRCTDLYQGIDVPRYKLPFEREVGQTPSLDQMRLLVNRHKARPLFPDIWKDSNYAIRLLKETITECWDHEPEARLTALCIEERITELPSLWRRHKMETLSSCYVIAFLQEHSKNSSMDVSTNNVTSNNECDLSDKKDSTKCSYPSSDKSKPHYHHEYNNSNVCYINKFENSLHCKYNDHNHLLHHPQHKHYFYQISLNNHKKHHLNLNMAEKNFNINNNFNKNNNTNNQQQPPAKLTLPLQPHHARNPCLERNLMIDEADERDEILEQGLKFKNQNYTEINFDSIGNDSSSNESNDTHNGDMSYSENRSLIQQQQQQTQAPMPIPFVQNYVNSLVESGSSSPCSIKIKDINKYRNSPHSQRSFFKQSIVNFLKRFNLELFNNKLHHQQQQTLTSAPPSSMTSNCTNKCTTNDLFNNFDGTNNHKENKITNIAKIISDSSVLMDNNKNVSVIDEATLSDDAKLNQIDSGLNNGSILNSSTTSTMISLDDNNYSSTMSMDQQISSTTMIHKLNNQLFLNSDLAKLDSVVVTSGNDKDNEMNNFAIDSNKLKLQLVD